ncbi:MAG: VCBS repeat-containing protein, partial [bacterium]|nr:VCBS repeat-containing protein [bacterium]
NADGTLDEIAELQTNDAVELVIEDFNGDGLPDLAIAGNNLGSGSSTPGVILQSAPREFGQVIALPGYSSTSVAVSDLNMDGASDLLSVSGSDRQLRAYFGSPSPCPADLNGDGELNFFDVSAFLVAFNGGDLGVDFNGDGALDFFDVSAFLTEYNAGCP